MPRKSKHSTLSAELHKKDLEEFRNYLLTHPGPLQLELEKNPRYLLDAYANWRLAHGLGPVQDSDIPRSSHTYKYADRSHKVLLAIMKKDGYPSLTDALENFLIQHEEEYKYFIT